jgi:hypothetical protein
MRSLPLSIAAFATFSAVALAQPAVEVTPSTVELGSVGPMKVESSITITNRGTDTLYIAGVAASCGCTVAKVENRSLAPGASTKVPVTVDTRRKYGSVSTQLTVATNDRDRPSLIIPVRGTVVRSVTAPDFVGPLSGTTLGTPHELTVNVTNTSKEWLKVHSPTFTELDGLSAEVTTGEFAIPAGESFDIKVRVTPTRVGAGSGTLTLATSDPVQKSFSVGIYTNVPATTAISGGK